MSWSATTLGICGALLVPQEPTPIQQKVKAMLVTVRPAALRQTIVDLGAMGSRRTHEGRTERLREHGLTEAEIKRVMSPIGLDIGARTPEETAVAICAEIIALRTGRHAASLRDTTGPIH